MGVGQHNLVNSNEMTWQVQTTACTLVAAPVVTAVADKLCVPAASRTGSMHVVCCPTCASVQLHATLENLATSGWSLICVVIGHYPAMHANVLQHT